MRYLLIIPLLFLTACGGGDGNTTNSPEASRERQPSNREVVTPPEVTDKDKVRAAELSMQAAQLIYENDNTGALELVEQAVELHPDKPEYHDQLAYVHEQLGRYDDALEHYREAASLFGAQAREIERTRRYFREEQIPERKNERRVLLRAANCAYILAMRDRAAGRLDEALDHAVLALKFGETHARYAIELGHVHAARKEIDDAIAMYDIAVGTAVGEERHEALHWKAQTQYGAGRYRDAIDTFTRLIDQGAEGYEAYGMRAYCYTQVGEKDKAISDFTQAVQRTKDAAKKAEYEEVLRQLLQLEDEE